MTYLEIGENNQFEIDGFKRYARITGSADDNLIRDFVRSAVLAVQEVADYALVPCKIEIEGEGRCLQLWQPIVATFDSVTDIDTGAEVLADCLVCGRVITMPYAGRWRIVYNTTPSPAKCVELRPYVWKIVEGLYDGYTEEEAKAMARIPAGYVVH